MVVPQEIKMAAFFQALKDLVPFGIIGLAIAAVLTIVLNPRSSKSQMFAGAGIVVIAILAMFDKWSQPGKLEASTNRLPITEGPSGAVGGMYWVDTGTNADWGGRDRAFTSGTIPKYVVQETRLCDENRAGTIATCWENRPDGYPPGNIPTDINLAKPPSQWCTYKDSTINLATPPDGRAPRGRVYLCARLIPHQ
jgi:hypothetical protein